MPPAGWSRTRPAGRDGQPMPLSDRARTLLLVGLGVASALLYLRAFTLRWPLWLLYAQPHLDYAWLSRYTHEGQAIYLGAFLALFGLQYIAYRLARPLSPSTRTLVLIVGGQLGFGLLLVGIYPIAALDIYDYLMYGRIVLVYGGNPLAQPPSAFPDPLVGYSPWPNEPSVYGPIWQLISLVPTALSGGDLLPGLIAFKLTALVFYLGCSGVIWRLLLGLRPSLAASGTLLFAWNPLLLFELAGNAHNDAVMVLFVLLAALTLVSGPRPLVLPLLAVAILSKILAAVLLPVFLAGLLLAPGSRRDRAVWILGGGAIALGLAVATYAPFWEGTRSLHFLTRGSWFTASFPTMLREYLRRWLELEPAGRLAAILVGAAFATFVVGRLSWCWRTQRPDDDWHAWLAAAHDVTFGYLAFACLWWEPWYLTWLVGLAALLPSRVLHDRALLFCCGGVANYVVFKFIWPVYQPMTYTQIMAISAIAIFGPPLLHFASSLGAPPNEAAREPLSPAEAPTLRSRVATT